MILSTDSKSLYNCLVKLGTTQEKCLMIDVMCLHQVYKRRLITKVIQINREANPADAMTKRKACLALTRLINTNAIDLQAVGQVERIAAKVAARVYKGEGTDVDIEDQLPGQGGYIQDVHNQAR